MSNVIQHLYGRDAVHAPASADPIAAAPTRQELARKAWANPDQFPPPKDGRFIIALGRVIYEFAGDDDVLESPLIGTTSEPFVLVVQWSQKPGEHPGWHTADGLSVARTLEDEVVIDYWLEDPR